MVAARRLFDAGLSRGVERFARLMRGVKDECVAEIDALPITGATNAVDNMLWWLGVGLALLP